MTKNLNEARTLVLRSLHCKFPVPPSEDFEGWPVPPLNVLDCVLSLNRNYDNFCLPRVQKFAEIHPEIATLTSLSDLIESYRTPLEFCEKELNYHDGRRATTLIGVLATLLRVQKAFNQSEEASRLTAWAHSVKPTDYMTFGVRGFGLSGFQYLRMLFGAQTVKPDVHICRFVSEAIGRTVGDEEALVLMEAAGKELRWPLSRLDYAVWKFGAQKDAKPEEQELCALRSQSKLDRTSIRVGS